MILFRTFGLVLLLGGILPAADTTEEEATPVSELDTQEFPLRDKVKANPGNNKQTAKTPLVASLSFQLFRQLTTTQEGNVCFAPDSLENLLQLLSAGAAGKTLDALTALPYASPDGENARHLHSVSALFAESGLTPHAAETKMLHFVPFADNPQAAADAINAWCRAASGGNQRQLVNAEELGGTTHLLAVNATYMHKKWQTPFSSRNTQADSPFHKSDGSDAPVAMMNQLALLRYAEGEDWRAVALDYRNNQQDEHTLSFIAILPKGDARAFAQKLTMPQYDAVRRALSSAKPRPLHLALPRMVVDSRLSFRQALHKPDAGTAKKKAKAQGEAQVHARKLFADEADFSPLVPGQAMRLDDILQACRLDVVEEKQAAGSVSAMSLFMDPGFHLNPLPRSLRFDRPFVWTVDDLTTGAAPAFLGLFEEPEAEK